MSKECNLQYCKSTESNGNLALWARKLGNDAPPVEMVETTPIIENAHRLYGMGLNVMPLTYGKKKLMGTRRDGKPIYYSWKKHQHTRLLPDALHYAFRGLTNIAVITGRTSANLFVIDCETATTYAAHKNAVLSRGLPLYAVKSGSKKGGGHIYFLCADGEIANIKTDILPDAEVRGNRGYVVGEGSLHPDGGIYQLDPASTTDTPPTIRASVIDWLRDKTGAAVALAVEYTGKQKTQVLPGVSNATRQFFTKGTHPGNRNEGLFRATCDMAGCGYTIEETRQWLYSAPLTYDHSFTPAQAEATLQSAYSHPRTSARAFAGGAPPTRVKGNTAGERAAQTARAFIAHPISEHLWRGQAGTTNRKVWEALIHRCVVDASEGKHYPAIFRASTREVAEIAQCSKNSVQAALKRLIQNEVLTRVGTNKGSGAARYAFCTDALEKQMQETPAGNVGFGTVGTTQDGAFTVPNSVKDIAENGAVGYIGMQVYYALLQSETPLTMRAIATCLGLSPGKVQYAMRTDAPLRAAGLVVKVPGGFQAVPHTDAQLQRIAARYTTRTGESAAGAGDRRKQQHQRERMQEATRRLILWRSRFDWQNYLAYETTPPKVEHEHNPLHRQVIDQEATPPGQIKVPDATPRWAPTGEGNVQKVSIGSPHPDGLFARVMQPVDNHHEKGGY